MSILQDIITHQQNGRKLLAVLIDPSKCRRLDELLQFSKQSRPDLFFVGGSQSSTPALQSCIEKIRSRSDVPIVIFPGDPGQIDSRADAILLLSLVSGRNPEFLIDHHVNAAMNIRKSGLEIIPTGYLLIDKRNKSATATASGTEPMDGENMEKICSTALASEQLGMKLVYLEAGSGALYPVAPELIRKVRSTIQIPLICGGGLTNAEDIQQRFEAGADIVVVGNHLEDHPEDIMQFLSIYPTLNK